DVVLDLRLRGLIAGLALLADQLLEVLEHREEQLLHLGELGVRGGRRFERGWTLAAAGDREQLIDRGLRLAAQRLGLRVELASLLQLGAVRRRCRAAAAATGRAATATATAGASGGLLRGLLRRRLR